MRIIRFETQTTEPQFGWIHDGRVGIIQGNPFGEFRRFQETYDLSDVKLLLPCLPSKIIAVGRNYREHVEEMDTEIPAYPMIFLKPPSSLITNGEKIILPPQSKLVEHEAELAVVVGKRSRWLTKENALAAVFGYTIANDVTARDLQQKDGQWTRAKSFDTFCPIGPWIETELNPSNQKICMKVNGEIKQDSNTKNMIFPPEELISFISNIMTLQPGDVIATGTPPGVGAMQVGDIAEVNVKGIGILKNNIINY